MRLAVAAVWVVYLVLFLRLLRGSFEAKESAAGGWAGMILQLAALGAIGFFHRSPGHPGYWADMALSSLGLSCAVAAVLVTRAALSRLGRQWSLTSRVRDSHQLITDGPFSKVRHPLYLAFFLLTAGTALALADWAGIALALPLSLGGAAVRARNEERLLRKEFGERFEVYAQEVPFLLPSFLSRSSAKEG
ncbi:MAG TPA: isoprenylcysteine carboxylmethyltransferase family protein [Acidobacteriota bacterium]|nr:isoprenylcysteine carboxylmethyltransferase family protein [Acidobacteriota bacterium]